MACPILTFYLTLNSNHWTLDVITFQDPFFQDICKPTSCLHHLIPPPRDNSVTTHHFLAKTQFPHQKVLFIHKLWPIHHYKPLETNIVTPNRLYTSLPAPMYIYVHCFVCCFIYYFNCISFAIRLSGRKVAIKLIGLIRLETIEEHSNFSSTIYSLFCAWNITTVEINMQWRSLAQRRMREIN